MNFNLLNKKWTSYFNWSVLYPSYFLLFTIGLFICLASVTFFINFKFELLLSILFILGFSVFVPIIIIVFIYTIWFLIASDTLFQLLGYNRLLANIINILLTYSGFGFITIIFLWMKIKDIYEENNIEFKYSGKIK